jgi:DNA-binding XRE family transcriptional regulator
MVKKGRSARRCGEDNAVSKFTSRDVSEIRLRHALYGERYLEIARDYNVTKTAIGHIIRGDVWKDVAMPEKVPIDDRFALWVRGFREHMGYRQMDLAAALGVHRVSVSRWEASVSYPDSLIRIHLNQLAREEGYEPVPRRWG